MSQNSKVTQPPPLLSAAAGLSGGCVTAILFCPIDVLRVRLAINHAETLSSATSTARTIFHREGLKSFYSGLGTTLLALGPNWAVYFTTYNGLKQYLSTYIPEGPKMHLTAAVGSAIITDFITNPLWMIKTRLQTQNLRAVQYDGIIHMTKNIIKNEGVFALWAGVTPQLLGVVHVAVQFPLYERLKVVFKGNKDHLAPQDTLLASAIAKSAASIVAYPHEVLRARFQYQLKTDPHHYPSIREAVVRIYANEGLRGFYKGMFTNLFRVVPSCAVTFVVYEAVIQRFSQM